MSWPPLNSTSTLLERERLHEIPAGAANLVVEEREAVVGRRIRAADRRLQHVARRGIDLVLGRELDLVRNVGLGFGFRRRTSRTSVRRASRGRAEVMFLPRVEADHVVAAKLVGDELALLVADVVVAQLHAVGELEVVVRARRDRGSRLPCCVSRSCSSRSRGRPCSSRPRLRTPVAETWLIVRFLFSTSVFRIGDVALDALAVAPRVVVRDEAERAEPPRIVLVEEPAVAERDLEAAVRAPSPCFRSRRCDSARSRGRG